MSKELNIAVLIVAGGKGSRLGGDIPKQYRSLAGKAVLRRSIEAFSSYQTQVVIAESDIELYQRAVSDLDLPEPIFGGQSRQESVFNGLQALVKSNPDYVLIHDAARPMVSAQVIDNVISELRNGGNVVIPGAQVVDTIKQHRSGVVSQTIDRNSLIAVQTPQGFKFSTIFDLHQRAQGMEFSDDAGICEDFGVEVKCVAGDINNFKITTEDDMQRAKALLGENMDIRIGSGFDVHAFDDGGDCVTLCGVDVPHSCKLKGHSDADVALHAIVDALLGSIAAGDIGQHFPPSDDKWKGANSRVFVKHACDLVQKAAGQVNHLDVTIICEKPKLTKYRDKMCQNIAKIMELDINRVSVKATTTEGLGFTGRKEGIAAQAMVTVSF